MNARPGGRAGMPRPELIDQVFCTLLSLRVLQPLAPRAQGCDGLLELAIVQLRSGPRCMSLHYKGIVCKLTFFFRTSASMFVSCHASSSNSSLSSLSSSAGQ